MKMWSSTKTWSRSIASRLRYSGRSWCSMVATDAWSRATCDSSAIVRRSRKYRWTRPLITRKNHVVGVVRPSPTAEAITIPRLCATTPSASSFNHSARSASGSADRSERPNDTTRSLGSAS